MRILLIQPGITKFIARKGDCGITEGIDVNLIVGVPFEVPDELAKSRIKANPNLFREATADDEKFAKSYQTQKIAELKDQIKLKQEEAKAALKEVESLTGKVTTGAVDDDEFNVAKYLDENEPLDEDKLNDLDRTQLFEVGKALELDFPNNVPSTKLIQMILDEVKK